MNDEPQGYVFRDPSIKNQGIDHPDNFRVMFQGRLCSPDFNSKGAAGAYLDMLTAGQRKPEWA